MKLAEKIRVITDTNKMAPLEKNNYEEIIKLVFDAAKNGESDIVVFPHNKVTSTVKEKLVSEGFIVKDKNNTWTEIAW